MALIDFDIVLKNPILVYCEIKGLVLLYRRIKLQNVIRFAKSLEHGLQKNSSVGFLVNKRKLIFGECNLIRSRWFLLGLKADTSRRLTKSCVIHMGSILRLFNQIASLQNFRHVNIMRFSSFKSHIENLNSTQPQQLLQVNKSGFY